APLRSAIVGCGRIAERHARILASFPDVEVVGMVDSVAAVSEKFAAAHGGRPYTDLSDMVRTERPGLVAVCTPSGGHAAITLDLVRLGVANVVVEKPMALTVSDADAMVAACEEAGARLFVVKQNRYNRPVVKLREAVDSGRPAREPGRVALDPGRERNRRGGRVRPDEMAVWRFSDPRPEDETILEEYRTNPPDVYGFGHHELLRDVVDAIRADRPPAV